MKVLYLSYDGMTDSLGQSQVLPYLKTLRKKGCSFHVISLEKESRFHEYKSKIKELCNTANIQWHPLAYEEKVPVFSAFQNYQRLKKNALILHANESFDIVHCRSDIPAMVGLKLQRKFNLKFVFDMRGFWADERVEGGIWNKKNPIFSLLYRFFKHKELQFFREADAIISLTKKGRNIIKNMPSLANNKLDITVIPCCVDLGAFQTEKIALEDQTLLKKTLNIAIETKVFGYLGSIGTWYMLDEMLAFYAVQRKKFDSTVFFFVSGKSPEVIKEAAYRYRIPGAEIIVKRAAHDEVPLYISIFDLSLFFIRPTFSKSASSPTKQGELMAMQVPIICNSGVGDTAEIIQQYKAGIVLEKLDKTMFQHVDCNNLSFDPKSARKGAEEWYSLENGSTKYFEVYQKILEK